MGKPKINPVHGKPMWGLVRIGADDDDDIDQEILDDAPHLAFMFSDVELIAMRVVISATIKAYADADDDRQAAIFAMAERGLEKLKAILNAELEDGI